MFRFNQRSPDSDQTFTTGDAMYYDSFPIRAVTNMSTLAEIHVRHIIGNAVDRHTFDKDKSNRTPQPWHSILPAAEISYLNTPRRGYDYSILRGVLAQQCNLVFDSPIGIPKYRGLHAPSDLSQLLDQMPIDRWLELLTPAGLLVSGELSLCPYGFRYFVIFDALFPQTVVNVAPDRRMSLLVRAKLQQYLSPLSVSSQRSDIATSAMSSCGHSDSNPFTHQQYGQTSSLICWSHEAWGDAQRFSSELPPATQTLNLTKSQTD